MKVIIMVKTALLVVLTIFVMIVLLPAMVFGGTEFLGEVFKVFNKELNKIRELSPKAVENL